DDRWLDGSLDGKRGRLDRGLHRRNDGRFNGSGRGHRGGRGEELLAVALEDHGEALESHGGHRRGGLVAGGLEVEHLLAPYRGPGGVEQAGEDVLTAAGRCARTGPGDEAVAGRVR